MRPGRAGEEQKRKGSHNIQSSKSAPAIDLKRQLVQFVHRPEQLVSGHFSSPAARGARSAAPQSSHCCVMDRLVERRQRTDMASKSISVSASLMKALLRLQLLAPALPFLHPPSWRCCVMDTTAASWLCSDKYQHHREPERSQSLSEEVTRSHSCCPHPR